MESGKLECFWENGKKLVTKEKLIEYMDKRNFKKRSFYALYNGAPISCPENGTYNVQEAANFLGIPQSHIYHLVTKGRLKSKRKGSYHVFDFNDLCGYIQQQTEKRKSA